jgi:PAS domain S-box-containing protein
MSKAAVERTFTPLDRFSGCGTYEWHVAENRVVWSDGLLDLFGGARAPTAEEGFTSLVHPDDRMRVEAETSGFLEAGTTYQHEFRILRSDGQIRYIHDRGEIERGCDGTARVLRGLNVDVTEQRLAQTADQAAQLNDAKGVGFYELDISQWKPRWSAEMFRLLGWPRERGIDFEAVARDRIHEDDRERLRTLQENASRRPGPYEIEYRVRHGDGGLRWLRDRGEVLGPINPATGLAWHVRGTLTDITDLKTAAPTTPPGSETFRQVIERAPWGIVVVDCDFRLIQASAGATKMFPIGDPVIGRPLSEVLEAVWPGPFASSVAAQFRQTLETGVPYHSSATRERRADRQSTEVYEWTLEQVRLPDGRPGVACYFYDLTDRARKEEALRESEERLHLAYEATGMGAWDLDLKSGKVVWTEELYRLLGLDPSRPPSVELFFKHVHPDDVDDVRDALERSIETGETFESSFRVQPVDGPERYVAGRGRIVRREAGVPTRMLGVNYDVTERRRMEHAIAENEKALRLILDNTVAFVGLLSPEGELLEINATALAAGGLSRGDVVGRPFWETPWWSHDADAVATLRTAIDRARSGEAVQYDAVVRMKGDTRMTIDLLVAPIVDEDGRIQRLVASAFDVTDRERANARADLLTKEINHRSKNSLALVLAIGRPLWRSTPDNFFERFESRLQALSASQDVLIKGEVDGAFLEDLARSQLGHFGELLDDRIHFDGPRISVHAEAAQALGMAFHELATNAGKYGALSTGRGEIFIAWSHVGGLLTLSWTETGGPPVEAPARSGFGSVVLEAIVRGTLSGDVDIDYAPEGLRWTLTCPDECLLP